MERQVSFGNSLSFSSSCFWNSAKALSYFFLLAFISLLVEANSIHCFLRSSSALFLLSSISIRCVFCTLAIVISAFFLFSSLCIFGASSQPANIFSASGLSLSTVAMLAHALLLLKIWALNTSLRFL